MGIEQAKSNHRFFSKRNSIRITTSKPNALIRTFWNSFWEKFWFRFCKLTQEQNLKHMDFRNRQKHSKRLLICQNHQNEISKVKKKWHFNFRKNSIGGREGFSIPFERNPAGFDRKRSICFSSLTVQTWIFKISYTIPWRSRRVWKDFHHCCYPIYNAAQRSKNNCGN